MITTVCGIYLPCLRIKVRKQQREGNILASTIKFKDPTIEVLRSDFALKKKRNPAFSLRAYARHLGVDASNLSKILSGKILPQEMLRKRLAVKLGISEDAIKPFSDRHYSNLVHDVFTLVSDPLHFALVELLKIKDAKQDLNWLALRLGRAPAEIKAALDRLLNNSFLKVHKGKFVPLLQSSSSILKTATSKAHRNQQKQILDKAIAALEETPNEHRSQTSMLMGIDRSKLPEAKELIKDFRREMQKLLSDSENINDVYQLSVSLFPLTDFYKKETK